jgi:hypothetical protein
MGIVFICDLMNRPLLSLLFVTLLASAALADAPKALIKGGPSFSKAVLVAPGNYVMGSGSSSVVTEFFKLPVPANKSLTIQMSAAGKGDTTLTVIGKDGKVMAGITAAGCGCESKTVVIRSDMDRTYYIKIEGKLNQDTKVNFLIDYEGLTFIPDEPVIMRSTVKY